VYWLILNLKHVTGEIWIALAVEQNTHLMLDTLNWPAEDMYADGYHQLAALKGLSASGASIEPQRLDSNIFKLFVLFGGFGYYLDLASDIYVAILMSQKPSVYDQRYVIWGSLLTAIPTAMMLLTVLWTTRKMSIKLIFSNIFCVVFQLSPLLRIYESLMKGIETTACNCDIIVVLFTHTIK
jgi:hypothetical protein